MKSKKLLTLLLIVLISLSSTLVAQHGRGGGKKHGGHQDNHRMGDFPWDKLKDKLTEDQLQELKTLIEEMRTQGATREEIHDAIVELLNSWGIELPERGYRNKIHIPRGILKQLTAEQIQTLKDFIKEKKEAGVTREEMHDAITALLTEWGIELPENWGEHNRHHGNYWKYLTENQKAIIKATIKQMREDGATREEIQKAIKELLETWKQGEETQRKIENNTILSNVMNHPNPFNPDTHISYTLLSPAHVKVNIYDMNGHVIKSLTNSQQPAGDYSLYWNGKNQNGAQLPSGVYFLRINAGTDIINQNMILVK